ncbi:hypothetical protein [Micromonospora sp. KC213]|uniref:hypothetical protein n=1 Tax=Micromonospora sp. KC213 TaxID=2530378 RepID=UPI0014055949|nr:hypothetical protein [Micromonospora sp. KC213]
MTSSSAVPEWPTAEHVPAEELARRQGILAGFLAATVIGLRVEAAITESRA